MTSDGIPAAFLIDSRVRDRVLSVVLAGTADMDARAPLQTFLRALHTQACGLGVQEVAVDFRNVEFMNSSCFKGFVDWLSEVQRAGTERHYQIRFLSNPALTWQRRSLQALRCFAMDAIRIEH
ncbi:MAG: hypothetical protein WKG00_04045 [Polyangiaceae bacterium]